MQRPVYQVCDSSSCSKKMKVKRRTPVRLLVAEFRLVACLQADLAGAAPRQAADQLLTGGSQKSSKPVCKYASYHLLTPA